jgi:hypothetical protein
MTTTKIEEKQTTGRLAVLLALPMASLMAWPMIQYGHDTVIVAGVIFFIAASVAGGTGLLTGGAVLITQLVKNNVHTKNTIAFVVAWVLSVFVYVAAVTVSTSNSQN